MPASTTSARRLLSLALADAAPAALGARGARGARPGPTDAITERILDAALHLVATSGLRALTMDDVAARAQVGRMTVYRRFGSRDRLIDALAMREARRCLAEIAGSFRPADPLHARAADVLAATLRVTRRHPLLARLAQVEPEALLHELTREDSEVFELVRTFLVSQIRLAQRAGELPAGDPVPAAELVLRLAASFVLIPTGVLAEDESAVREAMRMLLGGPSEPGGPFPSGGDQS